MLGWRTRKRWFSRLVVVLGVLALAGGLSARPAAAQVTVLEDLYLQEFNPFVGRLGQWLLYSFPGTPFAPVNPGSLGATFAVGEICAPSFGGGVFLSAGQGFGDLAFTSPWPFPQGTTLGNDINGAPLDLCDPNADEAWWFLYGDSLNNLPGGFGRFFGNEDTLLAPTCFTDERAAEGIFFFARRSRERQLFDIFCSNQTGGKQTLRAGNVLICRFPIGATWVTPAGIPTGIHLGPLFGLQHCQWYATCSANPVGPTVPRSTCATPTPPPGNQTGTVVVTVRNGNTSNPVAGASVTFPGGPTLTTNSSGQATFTNVPAGQPITFTAGASGFGPGAGTVTPVANSTTPLTINLPVVVSCSDFSHSGGDTGDAQIVELGKSPARFVFDFDTFTVKDRMVVSHDGAVLFDTGCVGASGSQTLQFSGGSTQVRVQVFPNCAGDTGTGWNYTVHCPIP